MNGFKRLLAFAALAPLLLHAGVAAAQSKVIEVNPPQHRTPVFAAGYEGDFTQVRKVDFPNAGSSPMRPQATSSGCLSAPTRSPMIFRRCPRSGRGSLCRTMCRAAARSR